MNHRENRLNPDKHFHLAVPVWGEAYTKLFTDVCLPMIMTSGNIAALGDRPANRFVIATTWNDHLAIRSSPSYRRLTQLIEVEFIHIDAQVDLANTHAAMSECYAMAMRSSSVIPGKTCFVFLTPDSFWTDGTFRRLGELADSGFKVVMAAGLRANREPMSEILAERIERFPDNPAIPVAELISLALANLHQMSRAHNVLNSFGFLNQHPSHLYWINEPDQQLIAHCFHLHPLLVLAPESEVAIGTTIDGEFLNNLPYPLDDYHVSQNEFFAIELSPTASEWGVPLGPPSLARIVDFSLNHANNSHWHFFGKRIVLNGSPEKSVDPQLVQLIDKTVGLIQQNWARELQSRKTLMGVVQEARRKVLRYALRFAYRIYVVLQRLKGEAKRWVRSNL